jgi:YVTN family beta-propeller protein
MVALSTSGPAVLGSGVGGVTHAGTPAGVPASSGSSSALPTVIGTAGVGKDPELATYNATGGQVYVASALSNTLSAISGTTLVATVNLTGAGVGAYDPVYDSADRAVDLTYHSASPHNISVVHGPVGTSLTVSNVTGVTTSDEPSLAVYDSWDQVVYFGDNGVTVGVGYVDGTTQNHNSTVTFPADYDPAALAVNPGDGDVYCVFLEHGAASEVAGVLMQASIGSAAIPLAYGSTVLYEGTSAFFPDYAADIAFDPADGDMYVADAGANNVTVVNLTSSVPEANVTVGSFPYAVAYDPADGDVYVTNAVSNNVSVLNGTTVVGSVPVGEEPIADAYDPADGDMLVANLNSSNVSVLNGTSLRGTVAVGSYPVSLLYDPVSGDAYVVDQGSAAVTVLGVAASSSPPSGIPPWGWGVIALLIVLLALLLIGLLLRRRKKRGQASATPPGAPAGAATPVGTPPAPPPSAPPGGA